MLLQEPQPSPYDLQFRLFDFPIRIAWTFWLGAAVLGFNLVQVLDFQFADASPGRLPLLLLWALALLISILIHELGHAFAFRRYGTESSIVLYHFGGLAIPSGRSRNHAMAGTGHGGDQFVSSLSAPRLTYGQELWIALAGPLVQLVSAIALVAVVKIAGYRVAAFDYMPWPLQEVPGVTGGRPLNSLGLLALVTFYVWPSVVWSILNLIPVFPLDGGRVMRSLVLIFGGRHETWLWTSLIVAGLVALVGLQSRQLFLGILFLSLAMGNYQMLQGSQRF